MSRIFVVLGMHRSGTSLLAAALECLGVSYGERLIGPRPDNPKGFWEDRDVVSLNDALYAVLDGFSSSLGFDEQRLLSNPECSDIQARIELLVSARMNEYAVYGIKDPRMPRLMEVWRPVLEGVGSRVDYLIPLRNPLSVAASLAARDGFSIRKGLLLWYEHMYRILTFSRGRKVVFVDYDCFLDSPLNVLRGMARNFDLPFDQGLFENFARDVMDEGLRHSSFESTDLADHSDAFPALLRLYTALCELAAGSEIESVAFRERLNKIDEDFNSLWTLLKHCGEQDIDSWKSWQERCAERKMWGDRETALTGWTHQLEADARSLREGIESLESSRMRQAEEWLREHEWFVSKVAGLEEMLEERNSALAWHQLELEHASMMLEERDSALQWCQSERQNLSVVLEERNTALAWHLSELERAATMLEERSSALKWHQSQQQNLLAVLEERNSAVRWHQSELEHSARMLEERSSALQWHQSELERMTARQKECFSALALNQLELERLSTLLVEQTTEAEHFKALHQEVLNSTSWRVTAPLRGLRRMWGNDLH